MSFRFNQEGNHLKLILSGDIDLGITPEIKQALVEKLDECGSFSIDGSMVSYIDSSGISLLVIAMQTCSKNDIPFTISKLSEQLMRVVKLAHLEKLLPVGEVTGPATPDDITNSENNAFTENGISQSLQSQYADNVDQNMMNIDDDAIVAEINEKTVKKIGEHTDSKEEKKPSPDKAPFSDSDQHNSDNNNNSPFKPGTF